MARRLAAEFLGTALLLVAIVGSGITASVDGAASAQSFWHAVVVGAALVGVVVTNAMFAEALVTLASTDRSGVHLAGSEALATFGLLVVIAALTVGALAAAGVIRWLFAPDPGDAHQVVVPHDIERPLAVPTQRRPS